MPSRTIYGIAILILLGMLVAVKQRATGSILEKPEGNLFLVVVNTFNLFFLLVANPLAAILLIIGNTEAVDPTRLTIDAVWLATGLELGGLILCLGGYFLMAWALISLGKNYQLGGSSPRREDKMVIIGIYRFVRHPMYIAALFISLGLACIMQSLAYFSVFCVYLVLIILLIPVEEEKLIQSYGSRYKDYKAKVKRLIPRVY